MSGVYQRKKFQMLMGGEEKPSTSVGQLLEVYTLRTYKIVHTFFFLSFTSVYVSAFYMDVLPGKKKCQVSQKQEF